jgi:Fe-S oxidoreductase
MAKSLTQYYREEKKRIIEKCKECGICAKKCPIIKHTELKEISPQDIQKQIKNYLENNEAHQTIFARAFSCMECFKCVDKCCPEGLNPLLVNEIIKWEHRQNKMVKNSKYLIEKLSSYSPETVIFWCPTCLCRYDTTLSQARKPSFKVMSFPQFVAQHMDKLSFKNKIQKTATLHEACISAFTGLDLTGAREILQKLPGVNLVEMPRHGKNTVCCGSGAEDYFPNSFKTIRDDRLAEAAQTHSDIFVDVCHHCHNVFCGKEPEYEFDVMNYVSLVAEALGIEREDKFKKYKQWKDLDRILTDAEAYVEASPFSREKMIEVVKKTMNL